MATKTQTSKEKRDKNAANATGSAPIHPPVKSASKGATSGKGESKPVGLEFTMDQAKVKWSGIQDLSVDLRKAGTQWDSAIASIVADEDRGAAAMAFFTVSQEATNKRRETFAATEDADMANDAFRKVFARYAGDSCRLHVKRGQGAEQRIELVLPRTMSQAVQAIMETHAGYDITKVASDDSLRRTVKSATDAMRYAARGYAKLHGYALPELREVAKSESSALSGNRIQYKGSDGSVSPMPVRAIITATHMVEQWGAEVGVLVTNILAHFNRDVRERIMEDVENLPDTSKEALEVVKANESKADRNGKAAATQAVKDAMAAGGGASR